MVSALRKAGFGGSHHVMTSSGPPARMVSVPVHGNRPLRLGTLSAILAEAGLSVEELRRLL